MAWVPPGVPEEDLCPASASSLARSGEEAWVGLWERPLPQSHTDQGSSERAGFCQKTGPNVTFPPTRNASALGEP